MLSAFLNWSRSPPWNLACFSFLGSRLRRAS